jgi:urease gamma subunit
MTITNQTGSYRWKTLAGIIFAGLMLTGLVGCSTTRQVSQTPKDFSGFLGDYSELHKGTGDQLNYVYIDKNAPWKTYTKVCILPIELWASEDPQSPFGKMSHEQQQVLVSLYHTAMAQEVIKKYEIVNQPGPDTLVIHAAITEARKSKPVSNLISSVYPAGLVISYGKQMITGVGLAVGTVRVEAYFTDGETGQRVAAVVDMRAGTKAWRSKFDGSWGDVKLAFDWWCNRFVTRLQLFQQDDFGTNDF